MSSPRPDVRARPPRTGAGAALAPPARRTTRAPAQRALEGLRARRALIGAAGLAALVLGALWIALGAASSDLIVDTAHAAEPGWLRGAFAGLVPGLTDAGFSVALLTMALGYVAVVTCADALSPRWALGTLALVALALTLAPPILSSDLFGYIGYARLGGLHHLDPYRYAPIAAPHDPILPLIYWKRMTSPYGPLFTLGSYALGHGSLPVAVWTLKGIGAMAWVASVALAWQCARTLQRPRLRAALVVGANPLLLVYALGGAHNDLLVMAAVLGALALLAARRGVAAGAALATAVAIKASAGIVLAFALLGSPLRRRLGLGAVAAAVPVVALTFAVFGTHVFDTIGEIVTGNSFNIDYSGPDLLGRMFGTGITDGVRAGCAAAVVVTLALSLRAMRRGLDWLTAAGWTTLVTLCAIASFVPWYVAWVLPMAALSRSRALRIAVLAFTAAVVVTHLPMLGFPAFE